MKWKIGMNRVTVADGWVLQADKDKVIGAMTLLAPDGLTRRVSQASDSFLYRFLEAVFDENYEPPEETFDE